MDFHNIHIYRNASLSEPDATTVLAANLSKIFPHCKIDIRDPFDRFYGIHEFQRICSQAAISEIKQPFDRQPESNSEAAADLFDGFMLQNVMRLAMPERERSLENVHIILTDMLTCTFDEDDWRYHARTVICGTPSMVSLSGIVEAPAKPKEYYYYLARAGTTDPNLMQKEFGDRYITHGDKRIASAILQYSIQAVFFFVTDGEPFCDNPACRLFNFHWQEELINNLQNPRFCNRHKAILKKFNARSHQQ